MFQIFLYSYSTLHVRRLLLISFLTWRHGNMVSSKPHLLIYSCRQIHNHIRRSYHVRHRSVTCKTQTIRTINSVVQDVSIDSEIPGKRHAPFGAQISASCLCTVSVHIVIGGVSINGVCRSRCLICSLICT